MSAILSPCGLFRYRLERELGGDGPVVAILGVNPSTAGATVNDQTIRKDIGFGRCLGWSRIIKGNKFAFRATDVNALRTARDPIGPDNDAHLEQIIRDADIVVAAWGPLSKLDRRLRRRWTTVAALADRLGKPVQCFGTAKDGQPLHTLMLPYSAQLQPWRMPL